MARGRGGSRGGGGGGRGGRGGGKSGGRGGKGSSSDAASSGGLDDTGLDASFEASSSRARASARQDSHANDRRALGREDVYDDVDAFMEDRHKVPLSGISAGGRGRKGAAAADDSDDEQLTSSRRHRGQTFELEGLEQDEDEEDEDEDEEQAVPDYFDVEKAEASVARARELAAEANISLGWGKNRSLYYNADTVDYELESDEEVAKEEEKEGRRLQAEQVATLADQVDALDDMMAQVAEAEAEPAAAAAGADGKAATKGKKKSSKDRSDAELLRDMDDEMDGIDMALDLDLDIAALTAASAAPATATPAARKGKSSASSAGGVTVERISKDLRHLSEADKLEAVLTSSPELFSLLDEFKKRLADLQVLQPVWDEMKDSGEQQQEDPAWFAFVGMKVNALALYCAHVSFYLSMKAEGRANLQSHPIMKTLLALRGQLDALQGMEESFAAAEEEREALEDAEGEDGEEEDELDADLDEQAEDAEDDDEGADELDDNDHAEDGEEGAEDMEQDDDEGMPDLPPVDPSNLAHSDLMSRQAAQLEKLLTASAPLSGKEARKAARAKALLLQSTKAKGKASSDFGEVDHKAEMAKNVTVGKASGKLAALQAKLAADAKAAEAKASSKKRKRDAAGDEDDEATGAADDEAGGWGSKSSSSAKKKASSVGDDEAVGSDLYAAAKAAALAKKAAHKEAHAPPSILPANWDVMTEDQRRQASKQIKANRGLVRSRRKDKKNPKTANRLRYEKKLVARSGQVQLYKGSQDAGYGGQQTGIKTTLTKSIKL